MIDFIIGSESEVIYNPEYKPSTAFAVIESKKGFMLLYNKFYKCWEITGGYMEQGESPRECVKRECKEESNQDITDLKFIGAAKYSEMNAAVYYSFLQTENIFIKNDEIEELRWWNPGEESADIDMESLTLLNIYRDSL
jgi:8-oxo-dGTP diphosphatase